MNSCKGCEDRHYLCHDHCERYANDKKEREAINKKKREYLQYEDYMVRQARLIAAKKAYYEGKK